MGKTSNGTFPSRRLNILHQEGQRSSAGLLALLPAAAPFFIPWFRFHSQNRFSHSLLQYIVVTIDISADFATGNNTSSSVVDLSVDVMPVLVVVVVVVVVVAWHRADTGRARDVRARVATRRNVRAQPAMIRQGARKP